MSLDPELIFDFENDEDVTATLGVEYGKLITPTLGFFVKPTVGLTDDTTDSGIKVGGSVICFQGLWRGSRAERRLPDLERLTTLSRSCATGWSRSLSAWTRRMVRNERAQTHVS